MLCGAGLEPLSPMVGGMNIKWKKQISVAEASKLAHAGYKGVIRVVDDNGDKYTYVDGIIYSDPSAPTPAHDRKKISGFHTKGDITLTLPPGVFGKGMEGGAKWSKLNAFNEKITNVKRTHAQNHADLLKVIEKKDDDDDALLKLFANYQVAIRDNKPEEVLQQSLNAVLKRLREIGPNDIPQPIPGHQGGLGRGLGPSKPVVEKKEEKPDRPAKRLEKGQLPSIARQGEIDDGGPLTAESEKQKAKAIKDALHLADLRRKQAVEAERSRKYEAEQAVLRQSRVKQAESKRDEGEASPKPKSPKKEQSPRQSPPSSPKPTGSGLVGGMSPQAGFVMRMMAENKKKHSGQYKKPTDPKHPESTMSSWRPFDYKKLANGRQGGESNTGYGASPFIQKHFKNGTVQYAPRGPNHQHLRDRGPPAEDQTQRNARKARRNLVALLRQSGVALPQATQQALAQVPAPQAEAPPAPAPPPAPKRATPYKSGFKNILEKLKKPVPKNKGGRPKKQYDFLWEDPNYNKKAKGRPKLTDEEKLYTTGKTKEEYEAEKEDERTGFHEGKWQEHEDRDKQEQEEAEARRKDKGRKYGLHKVEEKKVADKKAEEKRLKEEAYKKAEADRKKRQIEAIRQKEIDYQKRLEAIERAKVEEKEERKRQEEEDKKKKAEAEEELNRNTIAEIPSWWKTLRKVKASERKTQSDGRFEWFRGLSVTVRESKNERLATLTKTFLKWLFMKCLPSKGWQFVEYEPSEKDFPPQVESNHYQIKDKKTGKEIPGAFGYKNDKERVSGDRIALMGITSYYADKPPQPSEHPLPSKVFIIVPPTGVGYVLYGRLNEKNTVFDWDGITKCFLQQDYGGNASRPLNDGTFSLHIQMMKEGDRWVNMVDRYTEGSEYRRDDMPRKEKIHYTVNGRKVEEFGLFNADIMRYFKGILNALDAEVPVPEDPLEDLPVETRKLKIKASAPAQPAQPAPAFQEGVKPPQTKERALIIFVHKQHPTMTIRAMPGYIREHYDGFVVSQAEVQRKIRLFKEGKMDEDGKFL